MRTTDLALLCLTCLAALAFVPVFCEGPDSTKLLPSENKNLTCTGMDGNSTFEQTNSSVSSLPFVKGTEINARCENNEQKEVKVKYGDNFDPTFVGNDTWTCFTYGNGNKTFVVMELILYKPSNSGGTKTTCKIEGKDCPLVKDSEKESRFVIGMPGNCTAYTEPTTQAPPTTTAVPATTTKPAAPTTDPKGGETTTTSKPTDTTAKPSGDGKKDGADQVRLASACVLTALVATLASRLNLQL